MREGQVYKIIIRVQGGLGDQLFQYTAAMALHAQNSMRNVPSEVYVDKSWFTQKPCKSQLNKSSSETDNTNSRPFLLDRLFPHITYIPTNTHLHNYTHYVESKDKKRMFSDDFLSLHTQDVVLEGSFQNYRYYELAKEYIHPRLYPMPPQYKEIMKHQQLVSVHVRRGDYFDTHPQRIAPIQYYKEAFRKIKAERPDTHMIVCGEDEKWIEEHIVPELTGLAMSYSYERDREPYHQVSIMAQCQHFINTDDTLSAYACLLGSARDASIYMPPIHSLVGRVKIQDMLPKDWKILDDYPLYEGALYKGDERPSPRVSIIIPVHNTEAYLARCLDSASLQTEENIEIIVIDDVSPDNSWDIIQRYCERDTRIVGIQHTQNLYLGGARNTGIERARGKYLFFLDSDDFIRHDAMEMLLKGAKKNPEVELISGAFWIVDEYDVIRPYGNFVIQEVEEVGNPLEVSYNDRDSFGGERVWGRLWNRDLFMRTNIRFPEHQMFEDSAIIDYLLVNIATMIVVPERLLYYQERTTSIMGSAFSKEKVKDLVAVLQSMHNLQHTNISEKDRVIMKRKIYYVIKEVIKRIVKEWDREKHPFSGITYIEEEEFISQVVYKTLAQKEFPYEEQLQYVVSHLQDSVGTFLLIDYLEQEYLIRKQEHAIRKQEHAIRNLKQNRWYIFGKYSSKEKIRVVFRVIAKKIRTVFLFGFLFLKKRKNEDKK